MKALLFFFAVTIALTQIDAATNTPDSVLCPLRKSNDLSAELKMSLVSDHASYFLGETILLHYAIKNTGSRVLTVYTGGDYRGSTRADRFKITAVSLDGMPVADPTPQMRNMGGGVLPEGKIVPDGEWFEEVYINRYCRFDAPGTYTIHAFHDLGFGPQSTNDARNVTLTIELRAPTEEEACAILAAADNAEPYSYSSPGEKCKSRLDYGTIRWPTFLRPLQERAQKGSESALLGIASISTRDASRVLVGLLEHTNTAFAAMAAGFIEVRLTHPESDFQKPWGDMRRQFIIENAWEDSLSLPVRNYCLRLLDGTNHGDLLKAASLLRLIGTLEDVSSLQRAVEVALLQTDADYLADISYPAPIRAVDALLRAGLAINPSLDVDPTENLSPGNLLLFLARHGGKESVLSEADEGVFARALQHPLPYVRMKALDQLPRDIPASLADLVTRQMTDPNVGVQNYAFKAALRMQEPKHQMVALEVLKTATNQWLMSAANDIALKYNARYESALIWASRFVAPKDINDYLRHQVMQHLFELVVGKSGGVELQVPREAEAIGEFRIRWRQFLEANQQKIADGHLFKVEELPKDLGILLLKDRSSKINQRNEAK